MSTEIEKTCLFLINVSFDEFSDEFLLFVSGDDFNLVLGINISLMVAVELINQETDHFQDQLFLT